MSAVRSLLEKARKHVWVIFLAFVVVSILSVIISRFGSLGIQYDESAGDEYVLEDWVKKCTAIRLTDPNIRDKVKSTFGEDYAKDFTNGYTQEIVLPVASDLNVLDQNLAGALGKSERDAAEAYEILQITTLSSILLGLATTVLVSLSSTEFGQGKSSPARVVRAFAIALPAVGTAAAAITAFYSPQEDLVRSSQTLVSVRQVYDQVASEIAGVPCPTTEENARGGGEIAVKLAGWKKSFRDTRALADAAALAAVNPTRNQDQSAQAGRGLNSERKSAGTGVQRVK